MSSAPRLTRPDPTRTEPIRTFTGAAAAPAPAASNGASSEPLGAAVATAVDMGYRVLDEYLRQGQSAARRFGVRPERAEAAVDDLQALATRMARYTSDFLGVWAQFVDVALSAGGLGLPAASRSPSPDRAPGSSTGRTAVTVRLVSAKTAEVAVDIASDMAGRSLTVQDLRSSDPGIEPITGVRFEPMAGATSRRLHVTVPPHQPEGTYVGVVVDDESGRFAGTVMVTVLSERA